jgi:pimeloyl-ACP methyl ester carboxylesterase
MLFRLSFAMLILTLPLAAALARDSVITVPSRPGATQSFILMEPNDAARAVVIAWPSGDGVIGLTSSGMTETIAFFPRASARFVAAGLVLALADVPSDKPSGLDYDFRARPEHVKDVAAVIAAVRARTDLPIFLAGFSRGTLSVTNAAARLEPDAIAGVILASAVTVRAGIARRSVHDTPLAKIRVPVLVLNHHDDDCMLTPPGGAPSLLQALASAPRKESRMLSSGSARSGGCFAHTPHDFLGAEAEAVKAITDWITSVLAAR